MLGNRYRLIERVAAGGQGEVWRAEDTALGRQVAVKLLRAEYADSVEFRDRFHREARHAARLSHPGVAQLFDYDDGTSDTPPYLVMEYVDGESLSATIARDAPLSPEHVLDVLAAVASALAVAHAAGLVHRDIKPGNLLLGRDGSIKITDFGIARAVDAIPLTRTGTLLGTPLYLAPEQASGMQATTASDLYALGIIAFESLTGRPPYQGPAAAVLLAHRDAPLPTLPAAVPSGLRDLVLSLTAKNPAMRPADAAAVADRAARLRAEPTPAIPDRSRAGGRPTAFSAPTVVGHSFTHAEPAGRPVRTATQVLAHPAAQEPPRLHRRLPLVLGGLAIALLAAVLGSLARPSAPAHQPTVIQSQPAPTTSHTPENALRESPTVHQKPVPRPKGHRAKPHKRRK
ncbi:serine/threonine-protein kinase [Actinomadura alba]|uniref:non-specific serine/threonine protein kinase n=1 Tax=Actinomadura alba TaxID=406431 RepID=A0ABR7LNP2_9ACTN|nr:serine/threonine-protein kinase [Actinomadura alba]MBC6466477.1 serine/threonine protein kinase [Actinomadura alba]